VECLWEVHATRNGIGIGDNSGGEEEDVSHHDTEFNRSHTIPKQAVSDLLKTVLCLLKVVINVSAFMDYDKMCRILWRVSELQGVSLCRRWYILLKLVGIRETCSLTFTGTGYLLDCYIFC
jgi:hypothetical protein